MSISSRADARDGRTANLRNRRRRVGRDVVSDRPHLADRERRVGRLTAARMKRKAMMIRRQMNRTDWIVLVVLILLTVLDYYFDILVSREAGGYVVSAGL